MKSMHHAHGLPLMALAVGGALVATFGVGACSSSPRASFSPPPGELGSAEAGAPPVSSRIGCSADLRSIIKDDGTILDDCPADQGCQSGQCVPACDAAGAARGTMGCDFFVTTGIIWYAPPNSNEIASQSCMTAIVANGWPQPMQIKVERDGKTFDVTKFARMPAGTSVPQLWPAVPAEGLPPGQVAILFLSHDTSSTRGNWIGCPVEPALNGPSGLSSLDSPLSGRTKAFHITTSVPANVYDLYPFGGAKSYAPAASLILPSTSWGTNYVVAVPDHGVDQLRATKSLDNIVQIVAAHDDTSVTVLATDDFPAGNGTPFIVASVPTTIKLNAGEYVQWFDAQKASGTVLASDKEIAVFGGSSALKFNADADSAHQQLFPVSSLGSEYVLAPLGRAAARTLGHTYRYTGVVDGTIVSFDPPADAGVTSVALDVGKVMEVTTKDALRVFSQDAKHPFMVHQMIEGCYQGDGFSGPPPEVDPSCGGPEWVTVLPPAQFLKRYTFYTDVSYATTYLVVTRRKTATGMKDVRVGCLGVLGDWKSAGSTDEYTVATLKSGGGFVGGCHDGLQTAESDGPFGVTVWGLDTAASYAYPAGGNVERINQVTVPTVPR